MSEPIDVVAYCAAIATEWDYLPNIGNLGDALIAAGTFSAFAHAGVSLHPHDDSPDRVDRPVLIAGSGNLVPYYHDLELALRRIKNSDVSRVVFLPQTIAGHESLVGDLDARFEIFCREQPSYDHVRSLHPHFVGMAHDMAIHVDPDSLFGEYERNVGEATPRILTKIERIMTLAADHSRKHRRRGMIFRQDAEAVPGRIIDDKLDLPACVIAIWGAPVVVPRNVAMMAATFLRAISLFDEIETDRLHVAIAGGLLGIPVRLFPNSYYKNAAVHAMTISRLYPSVQMAGDG